MPKLPFYGTRMVKDIPINQAFAYIDEVALFRGQWRIKSEAMAARLPQGYGGESPADIQPYQAEGA